MNALLQVRMTSRRMPGKAMLPVLGRPVLWYNLERIAAARGIERIVVATSSDASDDPLASACAAWGVPVFRGSLNDVLDRNYRCAVEHGWEAFAKFTADNPLIDPAIIDLAIDTYQRHPRELDYFSNNHPPSWPTGHEVEIIRTSALAQAWRVAVQPHEREHVTPYLWDNPERFRTANLACDNDAWRRDFRWSLDYAEDFELIRTIFEELHPARGIFSIREILDLYERRPELGRINAAHIGKSWYATVSGALRTVVTGEGAPG